MPEGSFLDVQSNDIAELNINTELYSQEIAVMFRQMDIVQFKSIFFDTLVKYHVIDSDLEKFDKYFQVLLHTYELYTETSINGVEKIYLFCIFNLLKICLNGGQSKHVYDYLSEAKSIYGENFPYHLRSNLRDIELELFKL